MATGDIKYVITVDAAGAVKNVQDFDKAIEALGKGTEGTRGKSQSFGSELTGRLIPSFTAASLAADGIKKALSFVKGELKDTIEASIEAEKVDRALESSLQIVGEAAGGTADRLRGYASELMKKTVYDDEQIKSAQALMITMRGTSDRVDEMTRGAIGLASVFQMDLQSAARAVAQGFEGNYRAIGQLIPAVREAKDESEKHAATMKSLGDYYKRAEDETKTFGGRLIDLKKTYGELKETIGDFTTKNELVLTSLNSLKSIIEWINSNAKQQKIGILPGFEGMAQGAAILALLGAKAKQATENIEAAKVTTGNYAAVVWSGAQALKNFNPYMAAASGLFGEAPLFITKTGDAVKETSQDFQTIAQRVAEMNDDLRLLRSLGGHFDIFAPIKKDLGSLGDMISGTLGEIVNFEEKVPGLFEGVASKSSVAIRGMSEVWDSAMLSMTAGLISFGDANASVLGNVGKVFGNFAKTFIGGAESIVLKEILMATMASKANRAEAQSDVAKWWLKILPPPFSYIAAAASFAVVNSLFAKILKFEKGGFSDRPIIAEIGHGPEYILPEARLERVIERTVIRTAGGVGGGGRMISVPSIIINVSQPMTPAEIRRLGPALLSSIKDELHHKGYQLAGA